MGPMCSNAIYGRGRLLTPRRRTAHKMKPPIRPKPLNDSREIYDNPDLASCLELCRLPIARNRDTDDMDVSGTISRDQLHDTGKSGGVRSSPRLKIEALCLSAIPLN